MPRPRHLRGVGTFDDIDRRLLASVDRAIAADAAELIESEHVVYVYDPLLGFATVIGPFSDAITASTFAEQFVIDVGGDATTTLLVDVVPVEPPGQRLRDPQGSHAARGA